MALPAPRVSVEDAPAFTGFGLNDAVDPPGRPPSDMVTVCAEPEVTVVEMLLVPELPCTNVRLEGLAPIEKSLGGGGAVMVSDTVVEWVALAPVPVMVRV